MPSLVVMTTRIEYYWFVTDHVQFLVLCFTGNHPSKADVITNEENVMMGHRSQTSDSESDGQITVKA